MKKKISLLGLILILVLSFTGCGKSETTEYDQTTMEQYADTIISAFSSMSEEDMDYYENLRDLNLDITLLQAQLPIDGSDFLTMIESWKASQEECGAYIEHGDWTMKVSHDGATLSSEGKFEDRDAEIAFTFNKKSDMESMTVSAHYTTGEILKKAGLNTILGMGTVFVVLIFISFIIYLLAFRSFRRSFPVKEKLQKRRRKHLYRQLRHLQYLHHRQQVRMTANLQQLLQQQSQLQKELLQMVS